jgi:hypothetical protein
MQHKETKLTAMVFLNILLICDAESVARATLVTGCAEPYRPMSKHSRQTR